jgi:hypothetical protein
MGSIERGVLMYPALLSSTKKHVKASGPGCVQMPTMARSGCSAASTTIRLRVQIARRQSTGVTRVRRSNEMVVAPYPQNKGGHAGREQDVHSAIYVDPLHTSVSFCFVHPKALYKKPIAIYK